VLIETVGVGQSETVVAEMSDLFILLLAPAGGDELQGVKRGIMEIADLILVNKADGDLKPAATRTCADYAGALRLLRRRSRDPEGFPKAMTVSALEQGGLAEAWSEMQSLADWRRRNGVWNQRRAEQARHWFEDGVRQGLIDWISSRPELDAKMRNLSGRVAAGELSASAATAEVLAMVKKDG
jgi:LAO/AO transport system kinase